MLARDAREVLRCAQNDKKGAQKDIRLKPPFPDLTGLLNPKAAVRVIVNFDYAGSYEFLDAAAAA